MIDNEDLPIGFTMSLAQHSDILSRFASLSKQEQERIVDGARQVKSREEMNSYVEKYVSGIEFTALSLIFLFARSDSGLPPDPLSGGRESTPSFHRYAVLPSGSGKEIWSIRSS